MKFKNIIVITIVTTWRGKYQSMDDMKNGKGKGKLQKMKKSPEEKPSQSWKLQDATFIMCSHTFTLF